MRVSRHRVATAPLAGALAALAVTACGGSGSGTPAGGVTNTVAAENTTYLPSGAGSLPRGEIAVTGLGYRAQVRPATLIIAADGTLQQLHWSDWGGRRATATGRLTARICSTSCAAGHQVRYRASVVLSDPVRCGNRRYYNVAAATIQTVRGTRQWGSFLHAPCQPQPLVYH